MDHEQYEEAEEESSAHGNELMMEVPPELIPKTPPSLLDDSSSVLSPSVESTAGSASTASSEQVAAAQPVGDVAEQVVAPQNVPGPVDEYKGHKLFRKMAAELNLTQTDCKKMFYWLSVAIADSLAKNGEFNLPRVCKFIMVHKRPPTIYPDRHYKHDSAIKKKYGKEHKIHRDNLVILTCIASMKKSFTRLTQRVADMTPKTIALPDGDVGRGPAPAPVQDAILPLLDECRDYSDTAAETASGSGAVASSEGGVHQASESE